MMPACQNWGKPRVVFLLALRQGVYGASMQCLGIETSCDETALALVRDGVCTGSVLASQVDVHALFGGVVPELASREHYRFIGALYDELMNVTGTALDEVDAIAVARGPGLLGALLVGVAFAKGLALAADKPLVGVNHLHAHLLVAGLEQSIVYPALGLLVSGGHTHLYRMDSPTAFTVLGKTMDDAAGEAFDKFAKMLGLPYPGGALLDALSQQGDSAAVAFPRPYTHVDSLDFSFSGLKTSALTWLTAHPSLVKNGWLVAREGAEAASQELRDVCASYLVAVADTLRCKLERTLVRYPDANFASLVVAGGVAANTQVRAAAADFATTHGLRLYLPSRRLCTDNGIMIANAGYVYACEGLGHGLGLSAVPRGKPIPDDFVAQKIAQA